MSKTSENSEKSKKSGIWEDPRFSHLVSDPRFKGLPQTERKVKIDKRFQSMFNDERFTIKYTVDKYGRKVNKTSSEDLKKYYEIDSSDEEDEEAEQALEEKEIAKDSSDKESEEENDELSTEGITLNSDIKKKIVDSKIDYARGEGRLLTDSSSDEESSEEEEKNEVFIEHVWGELDNDAPRTNESTRRLASCNMDWDRIRAVDIMVLCSSFLPPNGSILSVTIYPSEYGKQRMAEEEVHGPPELKKNNSEDKTEDVGEDDDEDVVKEEDSDVEEGDEYHMEKLRQYQLNRLKYYYAVIECNSVATADKLYAECDGIEYESTATKMDLRFIPDDVTFDEDEPKDVCKEMPDLSKYKPRIFTTTALQQGKVDLTWDETSVERKELGEKLMTGKLTEINDTDLRKYVACSSDEEEDDENDENENEISEKESSPENSDDDNEDTNKNETDNAISKYKSLLDEINKKEEESKQQKFELEYTWGINVNSKLKDKLSEEKQKQLTPIEKILEKRKEKNKKRKEERKKKIKGIDENEDSDSSDDFPEGIDMNDPYFAEEFENKEFEPLKKKSSKKKGRKNSNTLNDEEENEAEESRKAKELELLLSDDDDGKQHFSLAKIQNAENESKTKKRRKKIKKSKEEIESAKASVEDNFKVNLSDNRFSALYTSYLFNIDPTDPHFKNTKGMEKLIQEKFKRRQSNTKETQEKTDDLPPESKRPRKHIENSILVKSLKRKIQGRQS